LALAPGVARAYRQWIREKDFYAVRQIHTLYRHAAARFAELKRARAGLDFTEVLLEAVKSSRRATTRAGSWASGRRGRT